MKTKILILAAMTFSIVGFSQKAEIKAAEKALKGGDAAAAKTALEGASSLIGSADPRMQAQYHFVKGNVYSDLAQKGDTDAFDVAISSYNEVISVEEKSGKAKYGSQSKQKLTELTATLVNSAVEDEKEKRYKVAAEKLYKGYKLSPKDTSWLYFAASMSVNGGHYEDALGYYEELKSVGYDGSSTVYTGVNVETGEVQTLDKAQRDLYVKAGTLKDPKDEKTPSKKSEIVKNIALIYTQLGQDEKALAAFKDARANDPNDVNLVISEANLYLQQGDKEKFKELMAEASAMAPDNPDLLYNIGTINMEQGNLEEARDAYRKALEINPSYTNAQINLSTTYVNEGNGLIDEMNSLGNSRADVARYDVLKEKKDNLFLEGVKILEDALKQNPDNQSLLSQLKNIYGALGDNENFMRVKKLLGE
ncbi:MAG: tetratricopeptide repeat protein [Bacteroidota bacterium]